MNSQSFSSSRLPLGIDHRFKAILEQIELEYKSIITDSHSVFNKKKFPEAKEAMESALGWIQEMKLKAAPQIDPNLNTLLDSFFMVSHLKISKIYPNLLTIIQKLVSTVKVADTHSPSSFSVDFRMSVECRDRILDFFAKISQTDAGQLSQSREGLSNLDEMGQIKILQIVMILLDPNQTEHVSKDFINNILQTCLQIFESKPLKTISGSSGSQSGHVGSTIVRNTLQACMKQLLTLVLDVFETELRNALGGKTALQEFIEGELNEDLLKQLDSNQKFVNSLRVVEDLINNMATALFIHVQNGGSFLTSDGGKKSQNSKTINMLGSLLAGNISSRHIWNFKASSASQNMVVDMITYSLKSQGQVLLRFSKIRSIVSNQILPSIVQILKLFNSPTSFPLIEPLFGFNILKASVTILNSLSVSCFNSTQETSENWPIIEQTILIILQMADFDYVQSENKEISSQNVHLLVFEKLTWRQVSGLEALSVIFQNTSVVQQAIKSEKSSQLINQSIKIVNKCLSYITLLDYRHFLINFQNINSLQDSPDQQSLRTLANYGIVGIEQPKKIKRQERQSIIGGRQEKNERQLTKRFCEDSEEFQILLDSQDDSAIKQYLQPSNTLKVAILVLNALLQNSLKREEIGKSCEEVVLSLLHQSIPLIEKAYLSVQVNFSIFDCIPSHSSSTLRQSSIQTRADSQRDEEHPFSVNISESVMRRGNLYQIEEYKSEWHQMSKSLLSLIVECARTGDRLEANQIRDAYLSLLCDYSVSKEFIKINPSPGGGGQSETSGYGQYVVTVNNILAFGSLREYVESKMGERNEPGHHELDIKLWQHIIEIILRIHSTIAIQVDTPSDDTERDPLKCISHLLDFPLTLSQASYFYSLSQPNPFPEESKSSEGYQDFQIISDSKSQKKQWVVVSEKQQKGFEIAHVSYNSILNNQSFLPNYTSKKSNSSFTPFPTYLPQRKDLAILAAECDRLLTLTSESDLETLLSVAGACERLLNEYISNSLKMVQVDQKLTKQSLSIQMVRAFLWVVVVNAQRLPLFHDSVVQVVSILMSNQKSQIYKKLGIELTLQIVQYYFQFKKDETKEISEQRDYTIREIQIKERNDIEKEWGGQNWQAQILASTSTIISKCQQGDKQVGLKLVERIIQTCGQNMRQAGWRVILDLISNSGHLQAFQSLKLITNNYIQLLADSNFGQLFNAIRLYSLIAADSNLNFTAINMFISISDFIPKINDQSVNVDQIWTQMLLAMKDIGQCERGELRRSVVQTMENIIISHAAVFSPVVWDLILGQISVDLLNTSSTNFFKISQICDDSVSPRLSPTQLQWNETTLQLIQTTFRIQKLFLINSSKDGSEIPPVMRKSWEQTHLTIVRLVQNLSVITTDPNDKIIESFDSSQVVSQLYLSLIDFLSEGSDSSPSIFLSKNYQTSTEGVLKATIQWLEGESYNYYQNQQKMRKQDILKTCQTILQFLCTLALTSNSPLHSPLSIPLGTVTSVLKCSQVIDSQFGNQSRNKLNYEQGMVIEFLLSLQNLLSQDEDGQRELISYILSEISRIGEDIDQQFLMELIKLLVRALVLNKLAIEVAEDIVEKVFQVLIKLSQFKYDWSVSKRIYQRKRQVNQVQNSQSNVFEMVGMSQLVILAGILSPGSLQRRIEEFNKKEMKKTTDIKTRDVIKEEIQISHQIIAVSLLAPLVQSDESLESPSNNQFDAQSKLRDKLWGLLLEILDFGVITDLKRFDLANQTSLPDSEEGLFLDLIQTNNRIELATLNIIIYDLLPALGFQKKQIRPDLFEKIQKALIRIIDSACGQGQLTKAINRDPDEKMEESFIGSPQVAIEIQVQTLKFLENSGFQRESQGLHLKNQSLSKFCLFDLFKIQKMKQDEVGEEIGYVGTLTCSILIERCREILQKFSMDEQRSGSIKLPQSRNNEVIFILRELSQVSKRLGQGEGGGSGHQIEGMDLEFLIDLTPTLIGLITCDSIEIRSCLKEILLQVVGSQIKK